MLTAFEAVAGLPTITRFNGISDSGEYGNANCPHCDAKGRYVYHFDTTEGPRGAMAGCIKLFPVSPVANEHKKLMEKQRKLIGEAWPDGRPKELNSWDKKKLDAIERFYAEEITEEQARDVIASETYKAKEWARKKYGR